MNKIKNLKKINTKDNYSDFLFYLHRFLVEKIKKILSVDINIEINTNDSKYIDIFLSPAISKIIKKIDKRIV